MYLLWFLLPFDRLEIVAFGNTRTFRRQCFHGNEFSAFLKQLKWPGFLLLRPCGVFYLHAHAFYWFLIRLFCLRLHILAVRLRIVLYQVLLSFVSSFMLSLIVFSRLLAKCLVCLVLFFTSHKELSVKLNQTQIMTWWRIKILY